MGLLDDAIREHLDLKRRHGADPTEIEREEQEALGPARRGPDELDEPLLDHQAGAEQELAYDHEEEGGWEESFEDEEEVVRQGPGAELDYEPPHASGALEHEEPWAPEDPLANEEAPDGLASPPPHPAHDASSVGEETVEYELEDIPEEKDDDVLEETPEFLQDTPDHDRLWFEQRPPRDFDFDK
jgi:hypothetical protein